MDKAKALQIIRNTRVIYNAIAKEWNTSRFGLSPIKKQLVKDVKAGYKVLDIGCGNGLMTGEVARLGGQYFGLDISSKLLVIAKKKNAAEVKKGRAKFILGSAIKLPFKKNSFDFVFSFATLHHIPSAGLRQKCVSEIHRVLKPGGKAVIDVWNLLNEWSLKRFNIESQLDKTCAGHDEGDTYIPWRGTKGKKFERYIHLFSPAELKFYAKTAGFKKIRVEYYDREGKKKKNGEDMVLTIKK